jgi:MFS family permease
LFYGFFTVVTGFAKAWIWVMICRFLTGFGVGGVLVTTTILVSEAFHGKRRAVALGVLSVSIPIGIFSAGLINYLIASWRTGFSIGILPLLVAIAAFRLIREPVSVSAVSAETGMDAGKEARTGTATGTGSLRLGLFAPSIRKNLIAGSVIFGAALIGLWATFSWLPSWIQSLLAHSDGQKERGIAMMLMGTGGLLGGFASGWIVNWIGVRRTMIVCFVACFVLSFTLFKLTVALSPGVYGQIAVLAFFFGISQGALSVFIPQLFPQSISASATGFCFNIGRLFTATIVFFIGSLVNLLGGYGNAVFIFSFVFLFGLLATWQFGQERYLITLKKA